MAAFLVRVEKSETDTSSVVEYWDVLLLDMTGRRAMRLQGDPRLAGWRHIPDAIWLYL